MIKKYGYIILLSITAVFVAVIFLFSKKPKEHTPILKERKGTIALASEWLNTKAAIESLLKEIELNPENNKAKLELAQGYIQESRITGDHAYYDAAAIKLLDDVLKIEPNNFDALCCKATVLLSQHHFSEGLEIAKKAMLLNKDNAFVYGLACDANVELGNYEEAVKMCDKMMSIRPDIRSYARVSYLREIHGDFKGAIEVANLAVKAGYPGLEQTAWTRIILGNLYKNIGQLDSASIQYKMALAERPNYAFAIAGLASIDKLKGNYKEAINGYETAKSMIIEYSFQDELTDLYLLNNEPEKAKNSAKNVIDQLSPMTTDDENIEGHGHYADRELAYAYLKVPNLEKALFHANTEFARRPKNIDVLETLAWVKYKNNNYIDALTLITNALRTNSKNSALLCRAGIINFKNGNIEKGKELINLANSINPYLDIELKNEANSILK